MQHSFGYRGSSPIHVHPQLGMRRSQFGVYNLQRRLQPSKLQFYIKVIVAEAVVSAATSEPSSERWRPKTIQIADRKIRVGPSALKVGFQFASHLGNEKFGKSVQLRGFIGHSVHPQSSLGGQEI
jgi:hypothetical protein